MSESSNNTLLEDFPKIYLDYNATTPLEIDVCQVVQKVMVEAWGNPSSSHEEGKKAKDVILKSRKQVASMIGTSWNDILFLSGGTEANNMVLHSCVSYYSDWVKKNSTLHLRPHIITSSVEHDAIKQPLLCKYSKVADVTYLENDNLLKSVCDAIRPSSCLVTIMMANNETGLVFPISDIARLILKVNKKRKREGLPKVWFHTDAAQAIGKIPVDISDLNVDYLTIVGHKFYGPRIGALYVRDLGKHTPVRPIFYGGGQERSLRPGTENTPMIAGLGEACHLVTKNLAKYAADMAEKRNYFEEQVKIALGNVVKINCLEPCILNDPDACFEESLKTRPNSVTFVRLPNTSSLSFNIKKATGDDVLKKCPAILASTGAACHSFSEDKGILEASGVCVFHSRRTVRFSVGRETSKVEIDAAVHHLKNAVFELANVG